MLDALSTAVIELDPEQLIRSMNRAAEQCLEVSRDRANGRPFESVTRIPPELIGAVSATAADGSRRHLRECHLPGGLFECTVQRRDERLLLELYDMQMEQQLLQLQAREVQTGMLDLLRKNLGHELRNPLGGIRGAAQMLAAELRDQELGTLARLIMREVDRIEELIQRFGQPRLRPASADIHQVIDEAVELLEAEAPDLVAFERDYDPSIPELPADPSALRQVILNLARNAQQAGAGHIRLKTRVEHGAALMQPGQTMLARIDVEDDGHGVPEELRALLFLPLVSGRRDGTGLGLALAQQIAAAHGGLLSYEALDAGSRFSLRLPLKLQQTTGEEVHG